jgi:hypothetical protein
LDRGPACGAAALRPEGEPAARANRRAPTRGPVVGWRGRRWEAGGIESRPSVVYRSHGAARKLAAAAKP